MSLSYPAPAPPRTFRRFLQQAAAVSRVIATLLLTLVSLRFAVASVQRALTVSQSNFAEKPASHRDPTPRASTSATSARAPLVPAPSVIVPVSKVEPGQPRRMTLGVSAGPPRSDVYVNGANVGQTPFLGDTSCKTGQPIRIEIVPPAGAPLVYSRSCTGGALEISGPPP